LGGKGSSQKYRDGRIYVSVIAHPKEVSRHLGTPEAGYTYISPELSRFRLENGCYYVNTILLKVFNVPVADITMIS
jgi:hypothetical protein